MRGFLIFRLINAKNLVSSKSFYTFALPKQNNKFNLNNKKQ